MKKEVIYWIPIVGMWYAGDFKKEKHSTGKTLMYAFYQGVLWCGLCTFVLLKYTKAI
jgi:hypothetical protein